MPEELGTPRGLREMSCERKVNKAMISRYSDAFTFHRLLEGRGPGLRDRIPKLSRAKVNVIDAEEVHIFDMPCESRSPHAKIKIRGIHSRQAIRGTGKKAIEQRWKMSNIP